MSSEEPLTWRILLGRLINEPTERHKVAAQIGVNPMTLTRWAANISHPRGDRLEMLVNAFPKHRQRFIELIHKEIPDFHFDDSEDDEPATDIPSAFYSSVLRTYTNSPTSQHPLIRVTILQQLLTHLDPLYQGLAVSIYQCVAPEPGQPVQSVRETTGRVNPPLRSSVVNHAQFLGIESLPGNAIATGRPIALQSQEAKERVFPAPLVEQEKSALAYPIFASNRIAGCLYLSSTQPGYFKELRQDVVHSYIDLLALTFEPHEFYDSTQVVLGIMPPYETQQPYLKHYQMRVLQYLREVQKEKFVTMYEAEQAVLRELEMQFLHLRYDDGDTV